MIGLYLSLFILCNKLRTQQHDPLRSFAGCKWQEGLESLSSCQDCQSTRWSQPWNMLHDPFGISPSFKRKFLFASSRWISCCPKLQTKRAVAEWGGARNMSQARWILFCWVCILVFDFWWTDIIRYVTVNDSMYVYMRTEYVKSWCNMIEDGRW